MPTECGVVTVQSSESGDGTQPTTPGGGSGGGSQPTTPGAGSGGGSQPTSPGQSPARGTAQLPVIGPLSADNPRALAAGGALGLVLLTGITG